MFASSLQGNGPFFPVGFGHGFQHRHGYYWHHPGFYPGFQGIGHGHFGYQPVYNHGQEYQWHNKYFQNQEHHDVHSQNKLHQAHIKKNTHDYHSHHGYSFGQGSGQFPDYYNHNY